MWGGGGGAGGSGVARLSDFFYKESKSKKKVGLGGESRINDFFTKNPNVQFFFWGGGGGGGGGWVDGRTDPNQIANSPAQGQQLCKIILKSMHKCTYYDPNKHNI